MIRKLGLLFLLVLAVVVYFALCGEASANPESEFDGVHLCSPGQKSAAVRATAAATANPKPAATPTATSAGTAASLGLEIASFSQRDPSWGTQVYDRGKDQSIGCGSTIAQCGCAMTSVATVLRLFQIVTTPDGSNLDPSTLNNWFNDGAQRTAEGWVSQGYVYGNVVWTAANNLSKQVTGAPGLRFKGWGSASEPSIRAELAAGRPVVLEVPGHFIAAVGLKDDQILINDPYYNDRTTLAAYQGRVKSARLFEPADDLRALMISVPANLRVRVTDSHNRAVGTLAGGDPAPAIPGSSFKNEKAWRDPNCTERAPGPDAGVNTVFIPDPQKGVYTVEVLDPKGNQTAAAVYAYDVNGRLKMTTQSGGKSLRFQVDYDPGTPSQSQTPPTPTPTATPEPTSTMAPTATLAPTRAPTSTPRAPAIPTEAPTATPIAPTAPPAPTATATRPPTATPTPLPMTIRSFQLRLVETAQPACQTVISFSVEGDPAGTIAVLKATGGANALASAAVIASGAAGTASFGDPFEPGTFTYQLRATNSAGLVRLSDPQTVTPICIRLFSATPLNGSQRCPIRLQWQVDGPKEILIDLLHRGAGVGDYYPVNSDLLWKATDSYDHFVTGSIDYRLSVPISGRTVTWTIPAVQSGCVG